MRSKLAAPFTVGEDLEWTASAVADSAGGGQTYFDANGVPVRCVTKSGLDAAAEKIPAPDHATCKP